MDKVGELQKRPTLETVAIAAGVSKITASRALRNSDLVRPELRTKIAEAAQRLGYRINAAARNLRTQRTHTVAVVMENVVDGERNISDPLLLLMLGGMLEVLTPMGYAMLLTTKEHYFASSAIDPDGVILLGQGEDGHAVLEIAKRKLPTVVWGCADTRVTQSGQNDIYVIGSDNKLGGKLAAEHLLGLGRKRLLFLGDPAHPEVASRLQGVRDCLEQALIAAVHVVPCLFSHQSAVNAIKQLLLDGLSFDGVIAVSDYIAAGACDALIAHGIAIPSEVSVIGFDDVPLAATHNPPISSIRQDWSRGGRVLAETLLSMINGDTIVSPPPLPVELVVRASTGAKELGVTARSAFP